MAKQDSQTLDHTIPLRITPAMLKAVKAISTKRNMADLDSIRLACGVGLEVLKLLNYDVESAVAAHFMGRRFVRKHSKNRRQGT